MTVIVAARCRDAAIIASDSQATELAAGVRFDVQKLFQLTEHAVWGASGTSTIIDEARQELEASRDRIQRSPRIENSLRSLLQPILKRHYDSFLQVPGLQAQTPSTGFVVVGVNDAGPYIVEVDPNCQVGLVGRDWHAIGSGAGFAQMAGALLDHFSLRDLPSDKAQMVVLRALEAVVQTSHFGVGGESQMWVVGSDGCRCLSGEDLANTREMIAAWKEIERDALERLLGQPATPEAPPPPEV